MQECSGQRPSPYAVSTRRVTDSYLASLFVPALSLLPNSHSPISPYQKLEMGPSGTHLFIWLYQVLVAA